MPKAKREPVVLTDAKVRALKPDVSEYLQGDLLVPGFAVRVRPQGTPTYVLAKRLPGATNATRVTIGKVTSLTLAEARAKARDASISVRAGVDINREKRILSAQAASVRRHAREVELETGYQPGTFGATAQRYIALECGGLRRGGEIAALIRRLLLPAWGARPIADLRRRDLTALLDPIIAGGRIQAAHKVRETAIRIINWAVDRGDLEANFLASPSRGRKRAGILRRSRRDRVLSDAEIRAIWGACPRVGHPFGSLVRLLLMLGQRRDEVAAMEWEELDFDAATWWIPPTRSKTGMGHSVPLPQPAVDLLRSLPRTCSRFVFSTCPGTHFSGFSKAKRRLDQLSGTANWRLHDLRRTARTQMTALRIDPDVAERVLGHVVGGIRGVYDRHAFVNEKREALERWATHLARIVNPSPDHVVRLVRL